MRKLSETNFYSLKDSEEIFLINKENKYNISYKNFITKVLKKKGIKDKLIFKRCQNE